MLIFKGECALQDSSLLSLSSSTFIFSMRRLILNQFSGVFLHLLCILNCSYRTIGIQDMKQTTWENVHQYIKYLEEQANLQLQKAENCSEANITNLAFVPEDNVIRVSFKLRDDKFQDCFKYFKIILEKNRRIVKVVTIPYDKQKAVLYRFENLSCGVYEILVQPCINDRSCHLFRWTYAKSINVTSMDCMGYSQKKAISEEKITEKIIVISSITALIFLTAIYELISYCYLSRKQKHKKARDKTDVAEHEYVKIATNEDFKTEIKSIHTYIFHLYDKRNIIKNKVETLKTQLELLLKYLFDIILQGEKECLLNYSIKSIDSELSKILFNPNNWLNDVMNENVEDGCLRKIIWVGSEIEEEEEDSLENLIFSEFKDKIKNNRHWCLDGYDNLFVVGLPGMHAFSKELENVVFRSRYSIPTQYTHPGTCLIELCLDLCSGSGLVTSENKERLKILLLQRLEEHLSVVQDVGILSEDC